MTMQPTVHNSVYNCIFQQGYKDDQKIEEVEGVGLELPGIK